jgi:hypothetical protein
MKKKKMKAEKFDEYFEKNDTGDLFTEAENNNELIVNYGNKRQISIEIPEWVLQKLDIEAKKYGVSRNALAKIWLVERLEKHD